MKWKIYFWVYLVITVLGLLAYDSTTDKLSGFVMYEGIIETVLVILAAWSYTFSKKIFHPTIWRSAFVIVLVIWFLQIFAEITRAESLNFIRSNHPLEAIIFSIIITVPAMIAMYRLGKGRFLNK